MTFLAAISSQIFWVYTLVVPLILGLAWGWLRWQAKLGRPLPDELRWVQSTAWLYVIATLAILGGSPVLMVTVVFVSLVGCRQLARATGLYDDWIFTGIVYLALVGVNAVAFFLGYDIFMASPIYAVAGLCALTIVKDRSPKMLQRFALAVMAFVCFGFLLAHLTLLGQSPRPTIYAYLFFLLYGSTFVCAVSGLAVRRLCDRPWFVRSKGRLWTSLLASTLWCCTVGLTLTHFTWWSLLLAVILFGLAAPLGELLMVTFLHDFRQAEGEPTHESGFAPQAALDNLYRLIFVAPLFFRLVHWLDRDILLPLAPG